MFSPPQLDLDPDAVVSAVKKILATMQHPPMSLDKYLQGLARCGLPLFSSNLAITWRQLHQ